MPFKVTCVLSFAEVVEEKSSDQIELSGGYGGATAVSSGRLIGTFGISFNNFSTRNIPKSLANLLHCVHYKFWKQKKMQIKRKI